jgi:hypothetical protein
MDEWIEPFDVLPPTGQFTTYGVDVTAFRGQTAELRFTALPPPVWNGNADNCLLDSISFSPDPVPEPGALRLFALATVFLCRRLLSKAASCGEGQNSRAGEAGGP